MLRMGSTAAPHLLVAWIFFAQPRPQGVSGYAVLGVTFGLIVLTVMFAPRVRPARLPPFLPSAIVTLAGISLSWSADPHKTLGAVLTLGTSFAACLVLAPRLPFGALLVTANRTLQACICASLLAWQVSPATAVSGEIATLGALKGIYEHRNGLGYVVVIALITYIARWYGEPHPRRHLFWGWVGVLIFTLYQAESVGAIVLSVLTLGIFAIVGLIRRVTVNNSQAHSLMIGIAHFALAAAVVAASALGAIIHALGRQDTINSRLEIWQGAVLAWQDVLWRGYGWGAVINGDPETLARVSAYAGYNVLSIHNGFLSTALQIGLVGVLLTVAYLLQLLMRSYRIALAHPNQLGLWAALVVTSLILGDMVETRAFATIGWVLLGLVATYTRYVPHDSVPVEDVRERSAHLP